MDSRSSGSSYKLDSTIRLRISPLRRCSGRWCSLSSRSRRCSSYTQAAAARYPWAGTSCTSHPGSTWRKPSLNWPPHSGRSSRSPWDLHIIQETCHSWRRGDKWNELGGRREGELERAWTGLIPHNRRATGRASLMVAMFCNFCSVFTYGLSARVYFYGMLLWSMVKSPSFCPRKKKMKMQTVALLFGSCEGGYGHLLSRQNLGLTLPCVYLCWLSPFDFVGKQ